MKLHDAIEKLKAIERQAPSADFEFVYENSYGYEVLDIVWNNVRCVVEVLITDQEES